MDLRLSGKRALITGGVSGIGSACAALLQAEGARVGIIDRTPPSGESSAQVFIQADVTREAEVASAIRMVADTLGGLDLLVCCAGISGPIGQSANQVSVEDWDAVMAVNLRGAFLCAKHAFEHLAAGSDPAIVMLASDSSFVASPGMAPYCASKGALLMLTRALSVDYAPQQIRVNCVCPSIVDTPMSRGDLGLEAAGFEGQPYPVQTPAQVAALVVLLASPIGSSVNGTAVTSDFGHMARSGFPA